MSKKKRKDNFLKAVHKQITTTEPEQLINKAADLIEAGKARDAIDLLKILHKQNVLPDQTCLLLFKAYLLREKQLKDKDMLAEAEIVKKQAIEWMPKAEHLLEADLIEYLLLCSNGQAFEAYATYLSAGNNRSAKAEQNLANRLFKSNEWSLSDKLSSDNPIRRDAGFLEQALPLMNDGNWEAALEALKQLPRTSPYAPIRMFCRAMVAFYQENHEDMAKALSMIPDDFPLTNVVKSLKAAVLEHDFQKAVAFNVTRCLWDGPALMEPEAAALITHLKQKRFLQVKESIHKIASAVYPENPTEAAAFILELFWSFPTRHLLTEQDYQKLIKDMLPQQQAELILAKTKFLNHMDPLKDSGQYIALLDREFPDPDIRKIAHSMILLDTVQTIHTQVLPFYSEWNIPEAYRPLLGIGSYPSMFMIDMAIESIRLNPDNRHAYAVLMDLPRRSKDAKKAVEDTLTAMLTRFPDDPYPCLGLASLYIESGAFRKTEAILEEAMKRAPHDVRVLERHAVSLLVSVDHNLKRRKFHIAIHDLDRAAKLGSQKTAPFISEKRMLFYILYHEQKDGKVSQKSDLLLLLDEKDSKTVLNEELNKLNGSDQLRTLTLLIADISSRKLARQQEILDEIEAEFKPRVEKIQELSSSEIVKILSPPEKDFQMLVPNFHPFNIFFDKRKDILSLVNNADLVPLIDRIVAPDSLDPIRSELERRIKDASPKEHLLFEFYIAVIYRLENRQTDIDLQDIMDRANGHVREELRIASRRLSVHASGALRKALEVFDFRFINEPPLFPDGFDPDDMSDALSDLLDEIKDIIPALPGKKGGNHPNDIKDILMDIILLSGLSDLEFIDEDVDEMIEEFEEMLTQSGVRGAPVFILHQFRKMLLADQTEEREIGMLAKMVEKSGKKSTLSHEARIVLFGSKYR